MRLSQCCYDRVNLACRNHHFQFDLGHRFQPAGLANRGVTRLAALECSSSGGAKTTVRVVADYSRASSKHGIAHRLQMRLWNECYELECVCLRNYGSQRCAFAQPDRIGKKIVGSTLGHVPRGVR